MTGGGDLSRPWFALMQGWHTKARLYFPLRGPERPEYVQAVAPHPPTPSIRRNHAQVVQQRSGSRSLMADRKELALPVVLRFCSYGLYIGSTGPDEASQYR